jgi:hypothetical protein
MKDNRGTEITPGVTVVYNICGQVAKGVVLKVHPRATGYTATKVEVVLCHNAAGYRKGHVSKLKNPLNLLVVNEAGPGRDVRREMDERRGRKCCARIWHGGGHQSGTYCEVEGPHELHEATYGESREVATWHTGQFVEVYARVGADWWDPRDGITGFFDEPPQDADL